MNTFKKKLALGIVAILMGSAAQAQWYLGPRAGMNMSNMTWNVLGTENQSIMGFHGGLTGKYQFSKYFSVQMDAIASTMGNEQQLVVTSAGSSVTTETTTDIFYLQTPLYIAWEKPIMPDNLVPYRVKKSAASFHLFGGGYFGYALSANQTTKTTTILEGESPVVTEASGALASDAYNPIDFGAMAGLGFSFRMDEDDMKRLGFDVRYLLGFSDFDKSKDYTATNSAIQVSLMFTKKLTKRKYTNRHQY